VIAAGLTAFAIRVVRCSLGVFVTVGGDQCCPSYDIPHSSRDDEENGEQSQANAEPGTARDSKAGSRSVHVIFIGDAIRA
jgi:hypothetical protein